MHPLCITFYADKNRRNSISHQEAVWDALGTWDGPGTPVLQEPVLSRWGFDVVHTLVHQMAQHSGSFPVKDQFVKGN